MNIYIYKESNNIWNNIHNEKYNVQKKKKCETSKWREKLKFLMIEIKLDMLRNGK